MSSIWDNCLTKLENEISNADFSTWIRPLQAIENEKEMKLLAPNRFVLEWVKQHHLNKITETVSTELIESYHAADCNHEVALGQNGENQVVK